MKLHTCKKSATSMASTLSFYLLPVILRLFHTLEEVLRSSPQLEPLLQNVKYHSLPGKDHHAVFMVYCLFEILDLNILLISSPVHDIKRSKTVRKHLRVVPRTWSRSWKPRHHHPFRQQDTHHMGQLHRTTSSLGFSPNLKMSSMLRSTRVTRSSVVSLLLTVLKSRITFS